jgi:hypothetical protein
MPDGPIPFVGPTIPGIEFPAWLTQLTPPGPDVPPDLARYFGVWTGNWGDTWGNTTGVTVFYRFTRDRAFVIFCSTGTSRFKGGCSSAGSIPSQQGRLAGSWGTQQTEYAMNPDGTLKGHSSFVLAGERGVIHWWGHSLVKIYP